LKLIVAVKQKGHIMRTKLTSPAGFTLVEVLVVLVIASIVLVVLGSVLGSSFEILRTGESRAQLNSNVRAALEYMSDDITSASMIPLSFDRDLNGVPDEYDYTDWGTDEHARWRMAFQGTQGLVLFTNYWISEAWSDRLQTVHDRSMIVDGQSVENRSFSMPKAIRSGADKVADYRSFLRLAIPANAQMPYYLAQETDWDGDGIVDARNTGFSGGQIAGYPGLVPVGPRKESSVLLQDLYYRYRDEDVIRRVRQMPISSNITRVKFEYLHEVPVYLSRVDGGDLEIAYQIFDPGNSDHGSVIWAAADWEQSTGTANCVPLVDHWELRVIDVAYDTNTGADPFWVDPISDVQYAVTRWRLQDQYPEGFNDGKREGTHVTPATGMGLDNWTCSVFYADPDGDDQYQDAPVDRLAFVTVGVTDGARGLLGNGTMIEGGMAPLRPDMAAIHGNSYYSTTSNPTGAGVDYGDADGIPDGDGIPDDPVPGWWLPYLRAVRITVVGTPNQTIEQRSSASGKPGSTGVALYYRLDSPVPYTDADRTRPLYNQTQDYIGQGKDLIVTKTVPVDYVYRKELITDPFSAELQMLRRVDLNLFTAEAAVFPDPVDPDEPIRARDPYTKYLQATNP
jgi:prepilin-type N-terminal cleavage/methylation domain-containing protein